MLEDDQIDEKSDLKFVVDVIISWNVHTSLYNCTNWCRTLTEYIAVQ